MRISRADFEVGNIGHVHQAVLDAIPEDEAVDESVPRSAYGKVVEDSKPSFEQVIENLSHLVNTRRIDGHTFYIRRKAWLSSAEVARRLGVSKRTVQAWGQQGLLLGRRVGGRLRFAAEAVEERLRGTTRHMPRWRPANDPVNQVWDNEEDSRYDRV